MRSRCQDSQALQYQLRARPCRKGRPPRRYGHLASVRSAMLFIWNRIPTPLFSCDYPLLAVCLHLLEQLVDGLVHGFSTDVLVPDHPLGIDHLARRPTVYVPFIGSLPALAFGAV